MIFVTVGSQKFPFDRLIQRVDQMLEEGVLGEEVFIQTAIMFPAAAISRFASGSSLRSCWRPAPFSLPTAARVQWWRP